MAIIAFAIGLVIGIFIGYIIGMHDWEDPYNVLLRIQMKKQKGKKRI